jgi:voltage-gated potassium channel
METTALAGLMDDFPFREESRAAVEALQRWKTALLDQAVDNPLETLLMVVSGAAMVIYLAEKDVNEGITTYADALHYTTTCLTVGYANIFPITQVGKMVAAFVMMAGPSLTAWQLEGRLVKREAEKAAAAEPSDTAAVVAKLEAILQELRKQ